MIRGDTGSLELAATDLGKHLACQHLIELERRVAEGRAERPHRHDPALELLIRRGIEHEETYVAHLRQRGQDVVNLREIEGNDAFARTTAAMQEGAGVIVQATLADGRWSGRADLLQRVDGSPSDLGTWSYEVVDAKLARETRGDAILQLALYSDLVGRIQATSPSRFHVVKPSREPEQPFEIETFRFADYQAYYRLVRRRLEARMDAPPDETTYPDPVQHCDICPWWSDCDRRRRDDDHLSLVAGMRKLHTEELTRQGIITLTGFAERETALGQRPDRGSRDTYDRLHHQARIQLEGRRAGEPRHELWPPEPERGLTRLPEPSPGDIFFDIEADPFVGSDGLEYLFGYVFLNEGRQPQYRALWAHNAAEERRAFRHFMDFLMERWEQFPGMHVYHFSAYESGALKRLMGRHATHEDEVDRLLRGRRLVDLHAITRQGLRASVESYSLKQLEQFFGFERNVSLPDARLALQRMNSALELDTEEAISADDRAIVEGYNREDCLATLGLRNWLEDRRIELIGTGVAIARPDLLDGSAGEHIVERRAEVQVVYDQLVAGLSEDPEKWNDAERAKFLLANLLDYFRRESKCVFWERFRLNDLDPEDLLHERKAIASLEFVSEQPGGTARCPVHRYRFPDQEVAVDPGDSLLEVRTLNPTGSVHGIDPTVGTVDIKKRQDSRDHHPASIMADDFVSTDVLEHSVLEFARSVTEHSLNGDGPFRAARDLLLRHPPRFKFSVTSGAALRHADETAVEAASRLAPEMDSGYLPIQGPPGAGKTFTGARMIAQLLQMGKRIGVTAVSHKVIRNLLQEAIAAGQELRIDVQAVHKPGGRTQEIESDHLRHAPDNSAALAALSQGKVVGGTCWLWAHDDAVEQLDYLFVDEAGQLSLAMMLSAARSARNLVLLGDPQQLEQPQQGSHPDGAEVSALEHILDGRQTIPDDRGLFLNVTWRLHPAICAFTSELYYEGRLRSRDGLERQAVTGGTRFRGSGLFFESVVHVGNQNRSLEEVNAVQDVVSDLLSPGTGWIDCDGGANSMTEQDIMVIAPYNAQVTALTNALPRGIRVGTVDKFQGQQASVVVYSLTSSSAQDAPRGMSFLYNPNRFNVATSRARCVCIVVGSPTLLEPDCRSPRQMSWANAFCRLAELAGLAT